MNLMKLFLDLHLDRLWTDSHNEGVKNQPKAADRAGGEHQVEAAEEVDDAAAERQERDARSEADADPDAWKKTECLWPLGSCHGHGL